MTDQPPSGRPDFEPPPGTWDGAPGAGPAAGTGPEPVPGTSATGPAAGTEPGPAATPAFPPPPGPVPPMPAPFPQPDAAAAPPAFHPGAPGPQPFPPAPPQQGAQGAPSGGRGSIVLGLVGSLVLLAISAFVALSGSSNPVVGLVFYAPIVLLVGGIVLAAIPRTTRTGAGILIGIGASILIAGGLCVALLATFNGI